MTLLPRFHVRILVNTCWSKLAQGIGWMFWFTMKFRYAPPARNRVSWFLLYARTPEARAKPLQDTPRRLPACTRSSQCHPRIRVPRWQIRLTLGMPRSGARVYQGVRRGTQREGRVNRPPARAAGKEEDCRTDASAGDR